MPNPVIDYAPSSTRGVSSLMAVGDEAAVPVGKPITFDVRRAAKYAVIGGAAGFVRGRRTLSYALAGAGVSLLLNVFGR